MDNQFTFKNSEEEEIKITIKRPPYSVFEDAQLIYNSNVARLIREAASGKHNLLPKVKLEEYLESIGVWTKDDIIALTKKQLRIRACETILNKGGIKLSEARGIAIEMKIMRTEIASLFAKRMQFDGATIEAVADQEKFIHILVNSCFHEDGGKVFGSSEEYKARQQDDMSRLCAEKVASMYFGYDSNQMDKLPENIFLRKHNMMNEIGQLVNKQNELVDGSGKRVDANGRFIDEKGEFIDCYGARVDEDGNLVSIETLPFIDDEPIKTEDSEQVKPKTRKRKVKEQESIES